jgi:Raf kinase inhibitor-like YbhB/YbcL family protein
MTLTSPVFEDGGLIPTKYSCDGDNTNPPLTFLDVPPTAKSLALIMWDPDVTTEVRADNNFDHWVVYNMPPDVRELSEATTPEGQQGLNTRGTQEYRGPCPPDREHRYFFKLLALDNILESSAPLTREQVLQLTRGHILAEAQLMGRYDRPR